MKYFDILNKISSTSTIAIFNGHISSNNFAKNKPRQKITIRKLILKNNEENFYLLFNSLPDVLFDFNIPDNTLRISDAYEKNFGYAITNNTMQDDDWRIHIHHEDKISIIREYENIISSSATEWTCSCRIIRADDSIAYVTMNIIIARTNHGKAFRITGVIEDKTEQKMLENKLDDEIVLKQQQIATAIKETKKTEKYNLGKKLDNTVNKLLGASQMYLGLSKQDDESREMFLNRSSEYIYAAIQEIQKISINTPNDKNNDNKLCETISNLTLVEKIKKVIIELIHSDETPEINYSLYLNNKFHLSYGYLAHLFFVSEGITLKKFTILKKIECIKELILRDELNLNEIAYKLDFSSAAHLSNQFKKVTGLTPSTFKHLKNNPGNIKE